MIKNWFFGIIVALVLTSGFYWQHLRDLEKRALEEQSPFVLLVEKIKSKPLGQGKLTVSVHPLNNPKPIMKIALNASKQERNRQKIERLLSLLKISNIHLETGKLEAYESAFLTIQIKHRNTIFTLPVSRDSYENNIQLKNFFKLLQVYTIELGNRD